MPTTTPSDEEKALYLLSGVVTVGGAEYVRRKLEGIGNDCDQCAHCGKNDDANCLGFLDAVRIHYVPLDHERSCPTGFV